MRSRRELNFHGVCFTTFPSSCSKYLTDKKVESTPFAEDNLQGARTPELHPKQVFGKEVKPEIEKRKTEVGLKIYLFCKSYYP